MKKTEQKSPCNVYDFTAFNYDINDVCKWLNTWCKKWKFQEEICPSTGKEHLQGKFSLKKKDRISHMVNYNGCNLHFSLTSTNNKDGFSYVQKEETFKMGGVRMTDEIYEKEFRPKQFKNISLYQYQSDILESWKTFDDRKLNFIYDPLGKKGKSTISSIIEFDHHAGVDMPPINDAKDLVQTACNICKSRNLRHDIIFMIDLPRSLNKERLYGVYAALEQMKKGHLYDTRFKYTTWWIDAPTIWVMSNELPNQDAMSKDRWDIYYLEKKDCYLGIEDYALSKATDTELALMYMKHHNDIEEEQWNDN